MRDWVTAERDSALAELQKVMAERHAILAERDSARAEVLAVQNSWSVRLTAPLRWSAEILQRLRRRD